MQFTAETVRANPVLCTMFDENRDAANENLIKRKDMKWKVMYIQKRT